MSPLLLRRLSDEQLGSRLAAGEAAAFDELYRRYVHRLAAYGAHLLGDASAGDDVAQSSLLKAYAALRDGRVPERVRPWLYRIAHNAAIDLVKRPRDLPSAELPERAAAPAQAPRGALVAALAALPQRQREVYALRELQGLRIDETAAELGMTTQQVEQALFAARNRMAEHLTFGERLDCVAVQRLVAGPLDLEERRALKSHLRSCGSCRSSLGVRGRALSLVPAGALEWLRGVGAGLLSGGAPVAAKVGVVVATATVAASLPSHVDVPKPLLLSTATATVRPAGPVPRRARPVVARPGRLVRVASAAVTAARPVLALAPRRGHVEHRHAAPVATVPDASVPKEHEAEPVEHGTTTAAEPAPTETKTEPTSGSGGDGGVTTVPQGTTTDGTSGDGGGGSGSGSGGHDGSGDVTSLSPDTVSGQNLDSTEESQGGHTGS